MTIDNFNRVIESQLTQCAKMLIGKGKEYAPEAEKGNSVDRLAHFKKAAAIIGGTPKEALLGMLTKHLVSVADMCTDGKTYSKERWSEKITDSINYLLILRAMIEED